METTMKNCIFAKSQIDFTRCSNSICQYGFSHEQFDENNAKLVKSKWRETGATKIIYL